jgi:1-deoxy-D-xylulose-5-phosphate reductoisomerase
VDAFIRGLIKFVDLRKIIDMVVNIHKSAKDPLLEEIIKADKWARVYTKSLIERKIS